VTKLGIGASLTTKEFNASTLARKLDTLITSQVILDRCKAYAERIDPDQALNETCAVIEEFATTSRRAPAP
jgi:UDP:flavonoid glycosyltransferase YjiC (YdhE family)